MECQGAAVASRCVRTKGKFRATDDVDGRRSQIGRSEIEKQFSPFFTSVEEESGALPKSDNRRGWS